MAGSLQRPPFKNIYPIHKCSLTSKYKSIIIKNEKLRLLRTKGKHFNKKKTLSSSRGSSKSGQEKPQQLHQLLKQVKYCQSLSWDKLLLLFATSLSSFANDSSWTTTTKITPKNISRNCYKNLTATTRTVINYVQQHQQQQQHFQLQTQQNQQQQQQQHKQQQLQLQLQLLQIFNKVFKSSKFCKNLLNRKKLQQLQLRQIHKFYSRNQLHEKVF